VVLSARNGSCGIRWNIAGTVISSEMAAFFCAPGGAPVEIVTNLVAILAGRRVIPLPQKKIKTAFCELCGTEHPVSEMEDFFGKLLCSNCLQAETFVCSCCHTRMPRSEVATYDDDTVEICQTCYDEHYTRCEGCGLLLRQPDANWLSAGGYYRPYCDSCYNERQNRSNNQPKN